MAAAVHGSMQPFVPGSDDWRSYQERVGHYFVANKVNDADQKKAILLTVCGGKTYNLIRSLVPADSFDTISYADLVDQITKHYSPTPSSIVQRFKFNTRVRGPTESIAVYVASLRSLSEFCKFGDSLSDMLRDRLVCGVNDERIQRRLLAEPSLTFDKALQLAQAIESADRDSKDITKGTREPQPIHYQKSNRPSKPLVTPPVKCTRCGGNHKAPVCQYKDAICRSCKKKGHLARVCRSGKSTSTSGGNRGTGSANYVQEKSPPTSMDDQSYSLFTLTTSDQLNPFHIDLELNGGNTLFQIDTGAARSLLSEKSYQALQDTPPILKPSPVVLTTYTGESLPVLGSIEVEVVHDDQKRLLSILVVKGEGPNLLGRDWLNHIKVDWGTIHQLEASSKESAMDECLKRYPDVFNGELGLMKGIEVTLHVKEGAKPQYFKPRSLPFILRSKVEAELELLQKNGIITPVTFSQWAAPVVPVVKQNGSIRLCGDYKLTVNQVIETDQYPLPKVDELFSTLAGGRMFSKLDLSQAYLQLPIAEDSRKYLTINTHKGLFTYNRLPFGVSSAPGIFQRTMKSLLQGISGVLVYLDDILVMGKDQEDHLATLTRVMGKLSESGLKLNKDKCVFFSPSVEYLGFRIDGEGIHPTTEKVMAINRAKEPTNVTERAFLGILNYYSKFLPNLATQLAPLYELLCKNVRWKWDSEQQEAFKNAKSLLVSDAVLTHYDSERELILDCDASPYGVGAIISHVMEDGTERPVAFASRTLNDTERRYSQLDKESLAIVFGVQKFHPYLYGRPFVIRSDHKPLSYLLNPSKALPTTASARLQRWALLLSGYQYTIRYRPGKDIANADALSRLPSPNSTRSDKLPGEFIQLINFMKTTPIRDVEVRKWIESDPTLSKVKHFVTSGEWPRSCDGDKNLQPYWSRRYELTLLEGCLLWGSRLVMPLQGRSAMLELLHESHIGSTRMKSLARGYLWWPNMDRDVEDFVKHCQSCQLHQPPPPTAPVHQWTPPESVWTRVHIDFAGPFLGHMFLVLVDSTSKWLEVQLMKTITSEATIEKLKIIFSTHGLPKIIVSDNGPSFSSKEFAEFCQSNGITHTFSAPYHPATNGLAERVVQSLKRGLEKTQGGSMQSRLSRFLFHYRITPHSVTGVSPSEALMSRRIRSPLDFVYPDISHCHQRKSVDRNQRKVRNFLVGEEVYVRDFRSTKPSWLMGKIKAVTGPVSYKVLVGDQTIRRHVDHIRPRYTKESEESLTTTEDLHEDFMDSIPLEELIPNSESSNGSTIGRSDSTVSSVRRYDSTASVRRSARARNPPTHYPGLVYY